MNTIRNNLHTKQYLLNLEIHNALINGSIEGLDKTITKSRKGIYLVGFRLLNKETNVIIYNYIYYPCMFFESFQYFLYNKSIDSSRFIEWGDLLVLLDSRLRDGYGGAYKEPYTLNNKVLLSILEDLHVNNDFKGLDAEILIRLIIKLNYICTIEEMSVIFDLANRKEYSKFIFTILKGCEINYAKINESVSSGSYDNIVLNLINCCLFVVEDLQGCINKFKSTGYVINEGPKPWRGQVNSISNLLCCMDNDYRSSLYNHHNYHIEKGMLDRKFELNKSHFSFRNIHMNLGNIRWYSTPVKGIVRTSSRPKKFNRDVMYKNLLSRINTTKSFKAESEIYLYLKRFLNNSPINEHTERAIEEYLLSFAINSEASKDHKSLIHFDLFRNKQIKNYIEESFVIINKYLSNFRKRSFNLNVKRITQKLHTYYNFQLILTELDNSVITGICGGILARIISSYNKPGDDYLCVNVFTSIGGIIIKSYYYSLYKKFIIINIEDFINKCQVYLINSEINKDDQVIITKLLNKIQNSYNKLDTYELKKLLSEVLNINENIRLAFTTSNLTPFVGGESLVNSGMNIDLLLDYTLSDWRKDNISVVQKYDDNTLQNNIGGLVVDWMLESGLLRLETIFKGIKQQHNILIPSEKITTILNDLDSDNRLKHLPLRIPMIVKPKLYSREVKDGYIKERLGGYLINDEKVFDSMVIPNWELKKSSVVHDTNVVYDFVNKINSMEFKINKEVLDFIITYTDKYNLLLTYDIPFKDLNSKITKNKYIELESYVGRLDLQENILGLARLFADLSKFYLPTRIDNRGRMVCVSEYLNYQSTELAKSLLLFSKGEKLMKRDKVAIDYFKAYGANCYGNKLDKKSWVDRSKWIEANEQDIINFDNGKLIEKADNKLLFIAFCIEYNKWLKSYNNIETSYFETHLPIQLDATCNGYQHLSLLISDHDMAQELNLTTSNKQDIPKDYYSFMVIKLMDLFKYKSTLTDIPEEDSNCYKRLFKIILNRKTIKQAIMTTPYNVSTVQMINYLKEHFDKLSDSKFNYNPYSLEYVYKEDCNVILCHKDLTLIALGLKEVLEQNFPKLKLLITYLKNIARIFTKAGMIITWKSSSGLLVSQSYIESKEIKLRPFSYNKSTFSLKVSTDKINAKKQIRSLMPNLIHSLDAAALSLLVHNLKEVNNFYAIHDCFAVTANNIDILITRLKYVYIKIYTEDNYLKQWDNSLKQALKDAYEDAFDLNTGIIHINAHTTEKYPNIDIILGKELPSYDFKNSSYLIS